MYTEKTIKANYLNFAVKIWGKENAPTILALHGWLDNAASFDLLAPLLSHYRVIAVDQCGHGKSDYRPPGVPYHFIDYVADGFYIADALGLDDFILMGHSMGANIAAVMAATFPERIKALLLIEGFGPASRDNDQLTVNLQESIRKFSSNNSKKKRYSEFSLLVKARVMGVWPLTEEASTLLCERGSIEEDGLYTWSTDPRINFSSPFRMSHGQARFLRTQVKAPVQVVIGEKGINPSIREGESPLTEFKDAQVTRFEGFHHLHMDRKYVQKLADLLLNFLAEKNL